MSRSATHVPPWNRLVRYLVLIPEAPLLLVLMLLAWLWQFPPLLSLVAALTALWFVVRTSILLLAEQRLVQGDDRRAGWLAQAALRLHPWSVDALLMQAQVYTRQSKHAAAEHLLRRAVMLDIMHGDAEAALATNLLAQGRKPPKIASARLTRYAASISPALLHHHAQLALHAENDPLKAMDVLERARLDRLPARTSMPLWLLLAEAYVAQERHDDARTTLRGLEGELHSCARVQQAEVLYHLGRLWSALGEDGSHYFRRSVELDPQGCFAHAAWRGAVTAK
jgi:tetratricopeptide (TPR) repeat protein